MTRKMLPSPAQRRVLEAMRDGVARWVTDLWRPLPTASFHACMRAGWLARAAKQPGYLYTLTALGRQALEAVTVDPAKVQP